MPRGRRFYQQSFGPRQAADPIPQRYLWWMELTCVEATLATRLWDALLQSGHPVARRLTWFFHRLDTRPVAAIAAQMDGLHQELRPQQWVALLEACVRQGLLSRMEANMITDALLAWTAADGRWRYCGESAP